MIVIHFGFAFASELPPQDVMKSLTPSVRINNLKVHTILLMEISPVAINRKAIEVNIVER